MKPESRAPKARRFLEMLESAGRYHFTSEQARKGLDISATATRVALNRMAKQGAIASPARGFYVIVPPEYRSLGCLPADQFLPAMMAETGRAYYAALLTAAQYHGASHQRPQEFQVFVELRHRPIACGKVRIAFMVRSRLRDVSTQSLNTPRGSLLVSTVEATALDLVGYMHRAGGLNHVATVLSELVERVDPAKLRVAAATAPVPWSQRLGYLMDLLGASGKVEPLKKYVREHAHEAVALLSNSNKRDSSRRTSRRSEDWRLLVNARVEPDL